MLTAMAHSPVQSGLPGMQVGRGWAAEGREGRASWGGSRELGGVNMALPCCPFRGRAGLPACRAPLTRAAARVSGTGGGGGTWGAASAAPASRESR